MTTAERAGGVDDPAALKHAASESFVHHMNNLFAMVRGEAAEHMGLPNAKELGMPFPGHSQTSVNISNGLKWPGVAAIVTAMGLAIPAGMWFLNQAKADPNAGGTVVPAVAPSVTPSVTPTPTVTPTPSDTGKTNNNTNRPERDWVFGIIKDEE